MAAILEIIYGPDFDMINEKNMIYVDNEYISSIKPIKFLEESIASCIGLNVLKYIDNKKIKNPFGKITVSITDEEVHIHTNITNDLIEKFIEICNNCYITNHLTFKKILINNDSYFDRKIFELKSL
jgi:uncharacterized OsmC-like protein